MEMEEWRQCAGIRAEEGWSVTLFELKYSVSDILPLISLFYVHFSLTLTSVSEK